MLHTRTYWEYNVFSVSPKHIMLLRVYSFRNILFGFTRKIYNPLEALYLEFWFLLFVNVESHLEIIQVIFNQV